jgi:hypothetical protein
MRHNAVCKLWKQRAKFHLEECSGDFGTFNVGIVFASQVHLKGFIWFGRQGGTSQEQVRADFQYAAHLQNNALSFTWKNARAILVWNETDLERDARICNFKSFIR